MSLLFSDVGHRYYSTESDTRYISVSTLVHALTPPFNKKEKAAKSSKRKPTEQYPNKWFGIPPAEIIAAWDTENKRSTDLGTWFHKKMENSYKDNPKAIFPQYDGQGNKVSSVQQFTPGIYLEPLIWLQSVGLSGQSDKVEIDNGYINITDYKSNKEIKTRGYENWEGIRTKMMPPLTHLEHCELIHYSLQLSLYAYIIQKNNPQLQVGKLLIEHVSFETVGKNQWGYPIEKLDENGEPIVKSVKQIPLRYMKNECVLMIEWLKKNRDKIH